MAIRHLDAAPKSDDYTPLQEHQEQTPTTFFGAKPVLHARHAGLTLVAPASQLEQDAAFFRFNAESEGEGEDVLIKDVEMWVSSENVVLFQTTPTSTGVAIPYPAIAIHATMHYQSTIEALYMNLSLSDAETVNDEDDYKSLAVTILPPNHAAQPENTCISAIYAAISTCADMHPDPDASDDDGEDFLDDSAPGASGWITADNLDEYVDENGNFSGMVVGEQLGPGAGTVRARDDGANGVNGHDGHEEKYYRTG